MRAILKIQGMTCQHCVQAVTRALQKVTGVRSVNVSLEHGRAEVEHAEDLPTQDLVSVVAKAGYTAEVLQSEREI